MKFMILVLLAWAPLAFSYSKIDVTTCGANPNQSSDSAQAIQNCINQAGADATIYFPAGSYKVGSTLVVSNNNVTLIGDSQGASRLYFTGSGDLLRFSKGQEIIYNGGIKKLWLRGNASNSQTAINIIDGSWTSIENVEISSFDSQLNDSIGIKTHGREGINIENVKILANRPFVLGKNPNHSFLDIDHFRFESIYTSVRGAESHSTWHFTLEDGVTITNMTIDGQNPMTRGCGILSWITTTPPVAASYHLKIANVRHESLSPGCDKQINISLPQSRPLQELIIDNIRLEGPHPTSANAIYVNNVSSLSVRDSSYPNSASSTHKANFIHATGAKFIELSNNHIYPYGGKIITQLPTLNWVSGPFRGKECCDPVGVRTPDSGILAQ